MTIAIDAPSLTYKEALESALDAMKYFRSWEVFIDPSHCQYFLFGYTTALLQEDLDEALEALSEGNADFPSQHIFWMGYKLAEESLKK